MSMMHPDYHSCHPDHDSDGYNGMCWPRWISSSKVDTWIKDGWSPLESLKTWSCQASFQVSNSLGHVVDNGDGVEVVLSRKDKLVVLRLGIVVSCLDS